VANDRSLARWLGQRAGIFARGLWFDLATLSFLASPWLAASALLPDRWRSTRAVAVMRWALLWMLVSLLLFGAVAEYVFWTSSPRASTSSRSTISCTRTR